MNDMSIPINQSLPGPQASKQTPTPKHDTPDLLQELFIKLAERFELLEGVRDERGCSFRWSRTNDSQNYGYGQTGAGFAGRSAEHAASARAVSQSLISLRIVHAAVYFGIPFSLLTIWLLVAAARAISNPSPDLEALTRLPLALRDVSHHGEARPNRQSRLT
jgi:hypothetical protein